MSKIRPIRNTKDLGALIRDQRKAKGYTQAELAGLCGVNRRFLYELEAGKPTAQLGLTLKVLKRLGLDVEVLERGARA